MRGGPMFRRWGLVGMVEGLGVRREGRRGSVLLCESCCSFHWERSFRGRPCGEDVFFLSLCCIENDL